MKMKSVLCKLLAILPLSILLIYIFGKNVEASNTYINYNYGISFRIDSYAFDFDNSNNLISGSEDAFKFIGWQNAIIEGEYSANYTDPISSANQLKNSMSSENLLPMYFRDFYFSENHLGTIVVYSLTNNIKSRDWLEAYIYIKLSDFYGLYMRIQLPTNDLSYDTLNNFIDSIKCIDHEASIRKYNDIIAEQNEIIREEEAAKQRKENEWNTKIANEKVYFTRALQEQFNENYMEAFNLYYKALGEEGIYTDEIYNNIAVIFLEMRQYHEALNILKGISGFSCTSHYSDYIVCNRFKAYCLQLGLNGYSSRYAEYYKNQMKTDEFRHKMFLIESAQVNPYFNKSYIIDPFDKKIFYSSN